MVCVKKGARVRGIFTFLSIILFISLEGKGAEERRVKPEKVTFGVNQSRNTNLLPLELGMRKGFYKKEGLEMDIFLIKAFVAMASLNSGDLDYGLGGGTAVRSIAAGMPIKLVLVMKTKSGNILVGKPGIHSVPDLKGKVIGISTMGSALDFGARAILRHYGLDPDRDTLIRAVGVGEITYLALKAGTVDAAVMNVLHVVRLLREKRGFIELMPVDEVMKGISNAIVISVRKLKENPLQIKKVLKATLRSIHYVRENQKEVIDLMTKEWGLERELAQALYTREREGYNRDGRAPDEAFLEEIKMAKQQGIIPNQKEIPLSQIRDFTLLEDVLKELGIK